MSDQPDDPTNAQKMNGLRALADEWEAEARDLEAWADPTEDGLDEGRDRIDIAKAVQLLACARQLRERIGDGD